MPPGPQARAALLGQLAMLGPLDRKATPAQQAIRVRLETLVQLVPPEPKDRKAK